MEEIEQMTDGWFSHMRKKVLIALSLISFMLTPVWGIIGVQGSAQEVEPGDTIVWDISTVSELSGKSSCALDSKGNIHLAFIDLMEGAVKYGRLTEDGWDIETVDWGNHVTQYTSIAMDSNDRPHLAFCYNSSEMNMDDKELVYAKRTEDGWSIEMLATGLLTGSPFSLALDSKDRPSICAYNFTEHLNEYGWFDYIPLSVKCVHFDGSKWNIETVDSQGYIGGGCSITIGSNDVPHITYMDHSNGDLKYALFDGEKWEKDVIDTDDTVRWYTSIVTDSNNSPHIAYYNGSLKYASLSDGKWSISILDPQEYVGVFGALDLDSSDMPHISYYDAVNGDLKYACDKNGTWMTMTVDSDESVGWFSSLVVDHDHNPHIFYDYGRPHSALKHATPLLNLSAPDPPNIIEFESCEVYIDIFWDAPECNGGSPVTRYDIYKGEGTESEEFLDSTTTTYYRDTSIENGLEYHYYIKAINTIGDSQPSKGVSVVAQGDAKLIGTQKQGYDVGEDVLFDVSAFSSGSGSYFLDYGDGANSSWKRAHTFTHEYSSPGEYTIVLKKKDDVRYPDERVVSTLEIEVTEDESDTYAGMSKEFIFFLFSLLVSMAVIIALIRILKGGVEEDEVEAAKDIRSSTKGKMEKGPLR